MYDVEWGSNGEAAIDAGSVGVYPGQRLDVTGISVQGEIRGDVGLPLMMCWAIDVDKQQRLP
jgi:hypothetical protein